MAVKLLILSQHVLRRRDVPEASCRQQGRYTSDAYSRRSGLTGAGSITPGSICYTPALDMCVMGNNGQWGPWV